SMATRRPSSRGEDREGQTHFSGRTERDRPIFRDPDAEPFFSPRPDPRGPARSDRPRPAPVRPGPGPAVARRALRRRRPPRAGAGRGGPWVGAAGGRGRAGGRRRVGTDGVDAFGRGGTDRAAPGGQEPRPPDENPTRTGLTVPDRRDLPMEPIFRATPSAASP